MPTRRSTVRMTLGWGLVSVVLAGLACPTRSMAQSQTCAGVSFPGQIQVAGETLVRNGIGVRRATLSNVHVYVAALYVEKPSRDASALLRADQVRSLSLRFVRDVTRDEMVDALQDGIEASSAREADSLKAAMKSLERMPPPLRKGNELTFQHVPGQGLAVLAGRRPIGTIASEAFASALFRIWLGSAPPDSRLKSGLLGGKCD
jgi:hypothetical protein